MGSKVIIPDCLVHCRQFEELSSHDDVEAVIIRDFFEHLLLSIWSFSFEVLQNELECFEVAGECNLDALVVADTLYDGSEVLYIVVGPLFVKEDFCILLTGSLDDYAQLLEVKRLFVEHLHSRVEGFFSFNFGA